MAAEGGSGLFSLCSTRAAINSGLGGGRPGVAWNTPGGLAPSTVHSAGTGQDQKKEEVTVVGGGRGCGQSPRLSTPEFET